ncbi:hypothetical protein D0Z08_31175 [Nocardioides immobilis]|uniref:Uncharacterized protein n=1 Tax=Nocardioides immobilis TaxID=2049295 RepID=A0A417XRR0_9ACTN|nr:hypothetical protein [Nocardioides immobilis]RHW22773.1 hypothetical protein D0Z08_31175 [Nocardioides immobilis]
MEASHEYLAKVGELAYRVSQLEWLIIDDIRLATTSIDAVDLHGLPTGAIGRAVETVVPELESRPNVQHFVATSARALLNVAARRNMVLHARPGRTRSGDESPWVSWRLSIRPRAIQDVRLQKLRVGKAGNVDLTWIDDAYLDKQISAVEYWLRRVERARELPVD